MKNKRNFTANPLKLSQPAGAALAFMGLRGCIPLWHGVQGCTAFAKILFIQHFREPMPFQTTALTQTSVVMGGDANLIEAVGNIHKEAKCIGVLTTGVAETCGVDLNGAIKEIKRNFPELPVAAVSTPDFEGTLETGWVKACESILKTFAHDRKEPRKRQAAFFVGPYMTPGEAEWLRETATAFGLRPVLFPDLGDSLYGRLTEQDFVTSSAGGTPLEEVETLADSSFVISIGLSVGQTAQRFAMKAGVQWFHFDHLSDIETIDRFFITMSEVSGNEVPRKFVRQRKHLMDTMLDAQFHFHSLTACVAGDPDFLVRWNAALSGIGATVKMFSSAPFHDLPFGDLSDFKEFAVENNAELLVGNSHVAELAEEIGVSAFRAGLPVYDRFGEAQSVRIGYDGLARLYMECANEIMEGRKGKVAPYVSKLQATLR
jgi:nitrogenase molybdenum-iron protein NifN